MIWVFALLVAVTVALMLLLSNDVDRGPAPPPLRVELRSGQWFVVDDFADAEHGPYEQYPHANAKLRELRKGFEFDVEHGDGGEP